MDTDYYRVLGVSEDAEPEVIEAAFKALAKKYHPDIWRGDKAFATEKLKSLNEARDILRDTKKRAAYDQKKKKGSETQSTKSEKPSADEGPWDSPKSERPSDDKGRRNTAGTDESHGQTKSRQKPRNANKTDKHYWVKLLKDAFTSTWVILIFFFILVALGFLFQGEGLVIIDLLIGLTLIWILIIKIFYQRSKFWIIALCVVILGLGIQFSIGLITGLHIGENPKVTDEDRKNAISNAIKEQVKRAANPKIDKPDKEKDNETSYVTFYLELTGTFSAPLLNSTRSLELGLGVSTQYSEKVAAKIEKHQLAFRTVILNTMSNFTEEKTMGKTGRTNLAWAIRDALNAKLVALEGFGGIGEVHFTSFIYR